MDSQSKVCAGAEDFQPGFLNSRIDMLTSDEFGMIEAVVNGLLDEVTWFRENRVKFLAGLCFVQFVCAIPMITQSGIYWVTLIDWYASGLSLMVAAVFEICCISWNYGVRRFLFDIKCMIGHRPLFWQWWQFAWMFVTPLCIMFLIITHLVFYSPVKYDGKRYPKWAEVIGWMSTMLSILAIPSVAIFQLFNHPRATGSFYQRFRALLRCDSDWRPRDPKVHYPYRQNTVKKELNGPEKFAKSSCCFQAKESHFFDSTDIPPIYHSE